MMCGSGQESRTKEDLMSESNTETDRERHTETDRGRERLMHCHVPSDHPLVYTLLNSNRG